MRVKRAGFEFGVELARRGRRDGRFPAVRLFPSVVAVGRLAGKDNAFFFQLFYEIGIDFIAMAMTFGNFFFAVILA